MAVKRTRGPDKALECPGSSHSPEDGGVVGRAARQTKRSRWTRMEIGERDTRGPECQYAQDPTGAFAQGSDHDSQLFASRGPDGLVRRSGGGQDES